MQTGITGIEAITYGVQDVEASRRFFEAFGLEGVESQTSGATFQTPEGAALRIVGAGDASLRGQPPMQPGSTVRELVWSVASAAGLDAIGAELGRDRNVTLDANGTLHSVDEMGLAIAFRVSTLERLPHVANATHPPTTRAVRFDRARPVHLGHVVFFTNRFEENIRLYTERLGFTLSDNLAAGGNVFGAFLRAPGAINHHNLFFIKSGAAAINHISFRVSEIGELMSGRQHLERAGFPCTWGPGRHTPSSAIFNYFRTPAGGYAEYHFDEDVILDVAAWKPQIWDATAPGTGNQWGPPAPEEFFTP